jgi:hypothetical protein
MQEATSEFIGDVGTALHAAGGAPQLSADERDIVDDFAVQEFSASACAEHIRAQRVSVA